MNHETGRGGATEADREFTEPPQLHPDQRDDLEIPEFLRRRPVTDENIAPEAPVQPVQPEQQRRRWFDRFRRQRPEQTEPEDQAQTEVDQSNEIDGHEPTNWQDLQNMIFEHDVQGWRERGLYQIYGDERLEGIGAFMDGERDFELNEDGEIQGDGLRMLKEGGRKILGSLVNKKNLGGAAAAIGVAIATGGLSTPAAMALAGGVLGRATVEAFHSINGEERKLREARASLTYEQYNTLRNMAVDIEMLEEGDPKRIPLQVEMLRYYNEKNTELDRITEEILRVKDNWDRKRNTWQFIGAMGGGVGGLIHNWVNLTHSITSMDLNGDGIAHGVERVNGVWHFIYNTTQEVAKAQADNLQILHASTGQAAHAVSAHASGAYQVAMGAVKDWAPKVGAVLGGMIVGRFFDRKSTQKQWNNLVERQAERGDLPEEPETPEPEATETTTPPNTTKTPAPRSPESSGGGGGGVEVTGPPQEGELWELEGSPALFRIIEINEEAGQARAEILNPNLSPMVNTSGVIGEQIIEMDALINHGKRHVAQEETRPAPAPKTEAVAAQTKAPETPKKPEETTPPPEKPKPESEEHKEEEVAALEPIDGKKYIVKEKKQLKGELGKIPGIFVIESIMLVGDKKEIHIKSTGKKTNKVVLTGEDWEALQKVGLELKE